MRRQTVEAAAIAVLAILALSVAAATLDTSTAVGDSGGIGGGGSVYPERNETPNDATDGPVDRDRNVTDVRSLLRPAFCVPALRDPVVLLGIFGLITAGVLALARKNDFATSVTAFALATGPGIFFTLALWWTQTGCESPDPRDETAASIQAGSRRPPGGGGLGGEGTAATAPEPSLLLLAVVGIALVAAVAVVLRGTGDDVAEPDDAAGEAGVLEAPSISGIAETAGMAADRIEESGDLENEVYRAWREMTTHLDAERPASSTPAEFREAAVADGMDRGHVDELTRLFEEVRYGGFEPTPERERRAVTALRAIEAAYGEGASR